MIWATDPPVPDELVVWARWRMANYDWWERWAVRYEEGGLMVKGSPSTNFDRESHAQDREAWREWRTGELNDKAYGY
jgi:hypothetical protein